MFFLLLLPFTIVVSRVMPFISFSLNAVCEQAQGGFFGVPCLHEDTQPWRQLSLVFCQNQGASDYSIILKWCPFYFPPPVLSPVLWFVVCTDLFASLILWNVWHNQSSLGTFFFFFSTRDTKIVWMRREEEVKIPWQCHQMRLHHLNQRLPVLLKKGKFLSHCRLSLRVSGPCQWPSGLSHPFHSQRWQNKVLKRNNFQARVGKVVAGVCYFRSSPFLSKRTGLILGGVCAKAQRPPPTCFPHLSHRWFPDE